jgi:hypothetical protein
MTSHAVTCDSPHRRLPAHFYDQRFSHRQRIAMDQSRLWHLGCGRLFATMASPAFRIFMDCAIPHLLHERHRP